MAPQLSGHAESAHGRSFMVYACIQEALGLPPSPSGEAAFAYVKVRWRNMKYKTHVLNTHKWTSRLELNWVENVDPNTLNFELWTTFPGPEGKNSYWGTVRIDLKSLKLNAKSVALYRIQPIRFDERIPIPLLKLELLLLNHNENVIHTIEGTKTIVHQLPSDEAEKEKLHMRLVTQMIQDTPAASAEDVEEALSIADDDPDEAIGILEQILFTKLTNGRVYASVSDEDTSEEIAARGRLNRHRKKHRRYAHPFRQSSPFAHDQYSLTEKEQKLRDLLPYCPIQKIRKALKQYRYHIELALDALLEDRIDEISQTTVIEQSKQFGNSMPFQTFLQTMGPNGAQSLLAKTKASFQAADFLRASPAPKVAQSPDQLVNCTGTRRALLIGCNYLGSRYELKGCIRDVQHMRKLITTLYGFPNDPAGMTVLTDDNPDASLHPTRDNILSAIDWLVAEAEPGTVLFFHYSGHGGQQRNLQGTEADGFDETLMPLDFLTAGAIIDDELFRALVAKLPHGVRLTCVMDCCHSGSGLDLPFIWDNVGKRWMKEDFPKLAQADVQLFAGCRDDETSADYSIPQQDSGGAMTKALRQVLAEKPFNLTYPQMISALEKFLKMWGFKQRPLLSSSQTFTFNRPFSFDSIVPNTNVFLGHLRPSDAIPRPPRPNSRPHTRPSLPSGWPRYAVDAQQAPMNQNFPLGIYTSPAGQAGRFRATTPPPTAVRFDDESTPMFVEPAQGFLAPAPPTYPSNQQTSMSTRKRSSVASLSASNRQRRQSRH